MAVENTAPATSEPLAARAREIRSPIRVRRIVLHSVELPLVNRFRTAHGTTERKRSILVRLEDEEGLVGWGEASGAEVPTYAPDTHDSTWYALTQLLVPRVAARSFDGPASLADAWSDLKGYHWAMHALECAAWAVTSQKLGRPLAQLWGGVREAVPVGESFGIKDSLGELLEEIEQRLYEGYCRIKVKIEPGWDVEVLRAVAARFPGVPLSADCNCGYAGMAEGPWWGELDELGLLMIEQPLDGEELSEMAELQVSLRTPLCLDESASSVGITRAALRLGAGRIVNIKPARLAGILPSLEVHDLCRSLGVPVWCGGMLETGIGRGFNLALASLPNFTLAADMSPAKIFYAEDLVDPTFDIRKDGTIPVPDGLGCGFEVDAGRVERYTAARWSSD
jgi:O-succinylbenzoate synthase